MPSFKDLSYKDFRDNSPDYIVDVDISIMGKALKELLDKREITEIGVRYLLDVLFPDVKDMFNVNCYNTAIDEFAYYDRPNVAKALIISILNGDREFKKRYMNQKYGSMKSTEFVRPPVNVTVTGYIDSNENSGEIYYVIFPPDGAELEFSSISKVEEYFKSNSNYIAVWDDANDTVAKPKSDIFKISEDDDE